MPQQNGYASLDLLKKAEALAASLEYDAALKFAERAVQADGSSADALEMVGQLQAELGNIEAATKSTKAALHLSKITEQQIELCLSLANLTGDRESVGYYQSALDKLIEDKSSDPVEVPALTIVEVCMAMIEVWMTELCYEPEASIECDKLLRIALRYGATPALLSVVASVRISQTDFEGAAEAMTSSLKALGIDAQDGSYDDAIAIKDTDPAYPTFAQRMTIARMSLELKYHNAAKTLLDAACLEQEDEAEAFYLNGYADCLLAAAIRESVEDMDVTSGDGKHTSKSRSISERELIFLRRARGLLEQAVAIHKRTDNEDEGILTHSLELLEEVAAAGVNSAAISEDEDGTMEIASDDEWTDSSSVQDAQMT